MIVDSSVLYYSIHELMLLLHYISHYITGRGARVGQRLDHGDVEEAQLASIQAGAIHS